MFATTLLLSSALALSVFAHPHGEGAHASHAHNVQRQLPTSWFQRDDHHAHALFVRDEADATAAVKAGTPSWVALFPSSTPDSSQMPQAWKDSLAAAVAAKAIPNFPASTVDPVNGPVYVSSVDPNSASSVCSATYKCRLPGDIWDAPAGILGVGFDDGPLAGSSDLLYDFLKTQNQRATHFFIGVNIIYNIPQFNTAYETLQDDIAVHTWTHPYMTSLSNEDVVAQLGYTMQAIRDLTGGRLPAYWRPPFGDSDARVSAIAKEVFGMTTIIWNQDTEDWRMTTGGTTFDKVTAGLQEWYAGPKSPGLIILEHELTNDTVNAFIQNFPTALTKGWKAVPMTSPLITNGTSAYRNAADDQATVQSAGVALAAPPASASAAGASGAAASNGAQGAAPTNIPAANGTAATQTASTTATGIVSAKGTTSAAAAADNTAAAAAAAKSNGARTLGQSGWLVATLLLALPFML